MNKTLLIVLVLLPLTLARPVLSEVDYQMNLLTRDVNRFEVIISSSGQSAALLHKDESIKFINTSDASVRGAQPFDLFRLDKQTPRGFLSFTDVDFLSVNDAGSLLAATTIGRFTGGPKPATCGIVQLDLNSGSLKTLFTYTGGITCTGTARGSINADGSVFIVYHDLTDKKRRYIYSYLRDGVKKDILTQVNHDTRFISPPPTALSDSGEAKSCIKHAQGVPGKLLFYTPESGLSLHTLPEILHDIDLTDISANSYLFIHLSLTKGVQDDYYVYSPNDSKDDGSIVAFSSVEFDTFLRKKYPSFKKNTHISVRSITPSGKLFSEIYEYSGNGYSFINVALVDKHGVELLVEKSRSVSKELQQKTLKKSVFVVDADESGGLYAVSVAGSHEFGQLTGFLPLK